MDEQQKPQPITTATAGAAQPETLAELANTPLPTSTPAAKPGAKRVTPQRLVDQAGSQMEALRQAETIKQLQNQMKLFEGQSRDASRVFIGTVTTLMTSALALVAALAWNEAIQSLFKQVFIPGSSEVKTTEGTSWALVGGNFGYALFITLIVVVAIWYLTKLNKRFGGESLIGEAPKGEGGKKE